MSCICRQLLIIDDSHWSNGAARCQAMAGVVWSRSYVTRPGVGAWTTGHGGFQGSRQPVAIPALRQADCVMRNRLINRMPRIEAVREIVTFIVRRTVYAVHCTSYKTTSPNPLVLLNNVQW